jgi:8-oxo-dGTP diphosphatase
MDDLTNTLNIYSNKLRVRVCGILIQNKKVLVIKHKNLGELGQLWIPPGGGVQFGESIVEALKREFLEESNLEISVNDFLTVNEHIDSKLHAIELFYKVSLVKGITKLGHDPEHLSEEQLLTEISYLNQKELDKIDSRLLHPILKDKIVTDNL